ncbi:response regulator [Cupriavidus plantarum]
MPTPSNYSAAPRILVAEDHPVCAMLLQHDLASLGSFDIAVHGSGADAWDAWQQAPVALLITDLNLPGMDGITLARAIRAAEGASEIDMDCGTARRTPIVALSASMTPTQRVHCRQAGIDAMAIKPIAYEDLAALLVKYLP